MFLQAIRMAWQAITGNKMRSFLTMLGIIIGVMALVVMVSLVSGATGKVTSEIASLGSDQIGAYVFNDHGRPLKMTDLTELSEQIPSIRCLAPQLSGNGSAKYGYQDASVSYYGTTAAYEQINNLKMESGRFLKTTDVENSSYVTVLSATAKEKLFGDGQAVGQTISLDGRKFLVVGVQKANNSAFSYMANQYLIYIPFSVAVRMTGQSAISSFYAVAESGKNAEAESAIRNFLSERFNGDTDAFYIENLTTIMNSMSTVMSTMQLLLGGIAAISLLVGGIGIMNIMLVSVTERTREIGIRKAIGAGRGSIMMQFLIEALMVSLFGCIIGLLLAGAILQLATTLAASTAGVVFTMTPGVVALAVGFSSAIGLIFGLYPANKAAKMPPIEALRQE